MQEKFTSLEVILDPLNFICLQDNKVDSDLYWQYGPTPYIGSWTDPHGVVQGSDLYRALKYLSSVNDILSMKKKRIHHFCSLLTEFFPANAFTEIPTLFHGLEFPSDNEKAIITILACIDLRLRLFKRDCLDPTIVHKVSAKYGFTGITRNAIIQERKRLFPIILRHFPEKKRPMYRRNYTRTRDIETRKLEQAAMEKLISMPGVVDSKNMVIIAKKLFTMMKKACYRVGNPRKFLLYFPIAVCRVAGYEWSQLFELFRPFHD
ncbi:MAG: hypothetical protein ACTSP4_11330 [Candidatus Hodarchaeales archaeon]